MSLVKTGWHPAFSQVNPTPGWGSSGVCVLPIKIYPQLNNIYMTLGDWKLPYNHYNNDSRSS